MPFPSSFPGRSALLLATLTWLVSCGSDSSESDLFGSGTAPSPSGAEGGGQGADGGSGGQGGKAQGGAAGAPGQGGTAGLVGAAGEPEIFGGGMEAGAPGAGPGGSGAGPGSGGQGAGPGSGGQGAGPGQGGSSPEHQVACLTGQGQESTLCAAGLGCCLADGPNPCGTPAQCQLVGQSFGFFACDGPEDCPGGECCVGKQDYDARCAPSCNKQKQNPVCHPGGASCPKGQSCQPIENTTIYGECVGG